MEKRRTDKDQKGKFMNYVSQTPVGAKVNSQGRKARIEMPREMPSSDRGESGRMGVPSLSPFQGLMGERLARQGLATLAIGLRLYEAGNCKWETPRATPISFACT
jgi:hypothetical protein